jgi:hypothetical protein
LDRLSRDRVINGMYLVLGILRACLSGSVLSSPHFVLCNQVEDRLVGR